jgi:hypothetical protein
MVQLHVQKRFIQTGGTLTDEDKWFKPNMKLLNFTNEGYFDLYILMIDLKNDMDSKSHNFKNMLKCINKFIEVIEKKIRLGYGIL